MTDIAPGPSAPGHDPVQPVPGAAQARARLRLARQRGRRARPRARPGMVAFKACAAGPGRPTPPSARCAASSRPRVLTPSCLAINIDLGLYPGRLLSTTSRRVRRRPGPRRRCARLPATRVGVETGAGDPERLLPLAEELGVKIGVEIHVPLTIEAPPVAALKLFHGWTPSGWGSSPT